MSIVLVRDGGDKAKIQKTEEICFPRNGQDMPRPNQNHGLDSSKANQREMGESFEGFGPYCSLWLANQQLEREPNEGLGPSPPYDPFLSKRKKMVGEGSIGPKSGEGYSCGGPLEINKKTREGSIEPSSSGTSSPRASESMKFLFSRKIFKNI